MRYTISGKHIDVGDALTTHVKTELGETLEKYSQRPTDASVTFSKDAHQFLCDTVVHLSTGLTVQARGHANDNIYAPFEACREKMDKQLRRYMRRLKDRHSQALAAEAQREAPGIYDANYVVFQSSEAEEEVDVDAPVVIAEMRVDIPRASVSDAVMMLDLRNTNALMFLNSSTATFNMVYRRTDGTIGWVEPPRA